MSITAKLVTRIHRHVKPSMPFPPWLEELRAKIGGKIE